MILYLDSSAIVKQYVAESGSVEVEAAIEGAQAAGTSVLSRAEVTAALKKGRRTNAFNDNSARVALRRFNADWPRYIRIRITEKLVKHAATIAWDHDLRGYDSVQLASAAAWQQALGRAVTLATFDSALWKAADRIGLIAFPPNFPKR